MLEEIIHLIESSISDDASFVVTQGGIIKEGYNHEIDTQKKFVSQGNEWLLNYQVSLIELTGISQLKIKFQQNLGYIIEVPTGKSKNIPSSFIHVQSLTQSSRFTTPELKNFEQEILHIQETLSEQEYQEFLNIRNTIKGHIGYLYTISEKISQLDFYTNAAYISKKYNYCTPKFQKKRGITFESGRHPVISQIIPDFITNSLHFSKTNYISVITGPNMGGKSTYLRQNALLILMAHMGIDIPCSYAELSLVDKIFSRVGAGDNIFLGQSTFMVEMQEMSYIVRNATENSFIIIDEVGRGTSTYDGMSLAWAILEYIQSKIGAYTLFATHYHEIIDHAKELKGVENFSVAVGENDDTLVFLRKIIPGAMKKSYGIEVARLAGIPEFILSQAQEFHKKWDKTSRTYSQLQLEITPDNTEKDRKIYKHIDTLLEEILNIRIDETSPLEALKKLDYFQEHIKSIKKFE